MPAFWRAKIQDFEHFQKFRASTRNFKPTKFLLIGYTNYLNTLSRRYSMQVELIAQGCPVCKGDVRGNSKVLYLCKSCNALFHKEALRKPRLPKGEAKKKAKTLLKGFEKAKPKLHLQRVRLEEPVEEPEAFSWKKEWKEGFVISLKSKRFHRSTCKYIQNIKRNNLAFFKSEQEALNKGFGRCRCLRKPKKKKWPKA